MAEVQHEPKNREGGRPHREGRPPQGGPRGEGGRGDDRRMERRPFDGPPEIDLEKLISDPLYLDNQAHSVVSRMRDMDSGTKSQLRRLYNAVRRATRAPENALQPEESTANPGRPTVSTPATLISVGSVEFETGAWGRGTLLSSLPSQVSMRW